MSDETGSSDEAIGRPKEWREGRYQQPGKAVDTSVNPPDEALDVPREPESKPVTQRDYE